MAEMAGFLVDQIFPKIPVGQWVLSFPFSIRYLLAYNDGPKYLLFSPEEELEKLAALVPIPRVYLTRYHGCL